MSPEEKLHELGLNLPDPPAPVAAYVPCVRTGQLVFVSGQLPFAGKSLLATGPVPSVIPVDQAQAAAEQCVLNGLAVLRREIGSLENVKQIVRVGVFVQSDDQFRDHSNVANGASTLLEKLFGEAGRHARVSIGMNALPMNASVEVEFLFEIRD